MNQNMLEHQYIMGERRAPGDPFKSQWRKDLERRRAEEEAAEQAWKEVYETGAANSERHS